MANLRYLPQAAQLQQPQQIDMVTPLKNYYAGQQQQRQNAMADRRMQLGENQDARAGQMMDLKVKEYDAGKSEREEQAEFERFSRELTKDKMYVQIAQDNLANIDFSKPEEDVYRQIATGMKITSEYLREKGVHPEKITWLNEYAISHGFTDPKRLKAAQDSMKEKYKAASPEGKQIQDFRELKPTEEELALTGGGDETKIDEANGLQYQRQKDGTVIALPIPGFVHKDKESALSALGKMIQEKEALHPDSPYTKVYERNIEEFGQKNGITVTTDKDGNTITSIGGPPIKLAPGVGTATTNAIQKSMFDSSQALVRLNEIRKTYDSGAEYLSAPGKTKYEAYRLLEKSGKTLTKEQKQYLTDTTTFASTALRHLNKTLNELSGAAVSVAEFERITQAMANPGKEGLLNLLSGDSATQFKTKLDIGIELNRMNIARSNYINKNGIEIGEIDGYTGGIGADGKLISLDQMPDIMNKRANEIGNKIQEENPQLIESDIRKIVREQVAQEFGLTVK